MQRSIDETGTGTENSKEDSDLDRIPVLFLWQHPGKTTAPTNALPASHEQRIHHP